MSEYTGAGLKETGHNNRSLHRPPGWCDGYTGTDSEGTGGISQLFMSRLRPPTAAAVEGSCWDSHLFRQSTFVCEYSSASQKRGQTVKLKQKGQRGRLVLPQVHMLEEVGMFPITTD